MKTRAFWRRLADAATHTGPGYDRAADREQNLPTALTTLAERWRQMAKTTEEAIDPAFFSPEMTAEQEERVRIYRRAADDLEWALRMGYIPHDLMNTAELEQHGTREADTPGGAR